MINKIFAKLYHELAYFYSSSSLKNDISLLESERLGYFAGFCQPRLHIMLHLIRDDA